MVDCAVVTLIFCLKHEDPPDPDPPTPPPTPPEPEIINPYKVNTDSIQDLDYTYSGVLEADQQLLREYEENFQNKYDLMSEKIEAQPKLVPKGPNNKMIEKIRFEFGQYDWRSAYLKLDDAENPRYSPPPEYVQKADSQWELKLEMLGFILHKNPFGFEFNSHRTKNPYVQMKDSTFIMMDKYIQLDLELPSQRIYGLGERQRNFYLEEGTWTMWANGQSKEYDDGSGGKQSYGVHPFILVQTQQKHEFIGIYFRNTNAMSPVITYDNKTSGSTFSFITTGGQVEIYFMFQGSAKQIIQAYQNLVGKPSLPPLWTLGWNIGSKAYTTIEDLKKVIQLYNFYYIPIEGIWLDSSYMNKEQDFSFNFTAFNDPEWIRHLKTDQKMKFGVILNAGLSAMNDENNYFSRALGEKFLIQSSINKGNEIDAAVQHVETQETVFPDYFSQKSKELMQDGLKQLYDEIPFDAIWLDMNEPTGKCNGECPNGTLPNNAFTYPKINEKIVNNKWWTSYSDQQDISTYKLPFNPGTENLDTQTLSLNATHPSNGFREYDTHSLFGHVQGKIISDILRNQSTSPLKDQRPFILSRSTYSGSGQYVAHWLGNNRRLYSDMLLSISGIMNFNMFGIPMTGSDVCGYSGDFRDDQMCARWIQLSTFFPFARQYSDGISAANEPYRFMEPYRSWATSAIYDRFSYIRLMYTCLFEASQYGGTCFDPLLFHYPDNDDVFDSNNTDLTFIVADAIKISPVLKESTSAFRSYFPNDNNGTWVSLNRLTDYIKISPKKNGRWVILKAPNNDYETINKHLRPGKIIPYQKNYQWQIQNTNDLQKEKISMLINRDIQQYAHGKLFIDDGTTLSSLENQQYQFYEFVLSGKSIKKWIINDADLSHLEGIQKLDQFIILNAEDLSDTHFACYSTQNNNSFHYMKVGYDKATQSLNISAIDGDTIDFYDLKDIYFGDSQNDIDMCFPDQMDYKYDKELPDLDGMNQFQMPLTAIQKDQLTNLTMTFSVLQENILNIHWTYANDTGQIPPFEVPEDLVNINRSNLLDKGNLGNHVVIIKDKFNFINKITIKNDNNTKVFRIHRFFIEDTLNFIDMYIMTNDGVIGLADQVGTSLFLEDGVYSLWDVENKAQRRDGKLPGKNVYGVHPFLMGKCEDESWVGIYTNLAAAQDWWIKSHSTSDEKNETRASVYATGGVGDISIIFGKTPEEVVQKYHSLVGFPVIIPQWALGWHQSRWRYDSVEKLYEVLNNYTDLNIPLEAIWNDIDYMKDYRSFTVGDKFQSLNDFVQQLHFQDKHYVPILDVGIAVRTGYQIYDRVMFNSIYLKSEVDKNTPFIGQSWTNDCIWIDFFKQKAVDEWNLWLYLLYEQINFDGIWLDLNEAVNFCDGACYEDQRPKYPTKKTLKYIPTGRDLETRSIGLDVMHANNYTELDLHSLYGIKSAQASHNFFKNKKKRTMIIERSAFAGIGKFASRWLGDNQSTIKDLANSITGIMAQNIVGVPLVGADICGTMLDTTPELCTQWYVVGAFYPLSRNHNSWNNSPQEPWQFKRIPYYKTITYYEIIVRAMQLKMNLIRYSYTYMMDVSLNGGTYFKPLFFEFPNDQETYKYQQNDFMIGPALKISVVTDNLNQLINVFYFPEGRWCSVFERKKVNNCIQSNGQVILLRSLAFDSYVHLREGYIIPLQNVWNLKKQYPNSNFTTTKSLQAHPTELHANMACNDIENMCEARGLFINDDGEGVEIDQRTNIYRFHMTFNKGIQTKVVSMSITQDQNATQYDMGMVNANDMLLSIQIYNADYLGIKNQFYATAVYLDGKNVDMGNTIYDEFTDRLVLNLDKGWQLPQLKQISLSQSSDS